MSFSYQKTSTLSGVLSLWACCLSNFKMCKSITRSSCHVRAEGIKCGKLWGSAPCTACQCSHSLAWLPLYLLSEFRFQQHGHCFGSFGTVSETPAAVLLVKAKHMTLMVIIKVRMATFLSKNKPKNSNPIKSR